MPTLTPASLTPLTAVVTKTRLPVTITAEWPSPGIRVCHATSSPVSTFHESGNLCPPCPTPEASRATELSPVGFGDRFPAGDVVAPVNRITASRIRWREVMVEMS
ncbi:MAG: hypothetical protein CM1200mP2_48030 [Planctomycetaceae bacterium]|nr:MAG: hypothetical protein CM1200mP2_48030 [Planctomycetaceae bacterium]